MELSCYPRWVSHPFLENFFHENSTRRRFTLGYGICRLWWTQGLSAAIPGNGSHVDSLAYFGNAANDRPDRSMGRIHGPLVRRLKGDYDGMG